MNTSTSSIMIQRVGDPECEAQDLVAVEEPLEIRVGDRSISITMRTPGNDLELAAGFLFSEGLIRSAQEIASLRPCGNGNVARVELHPGVPADLGRLQRHFYSTSSCGICGKASIEALRIQSPFSIKEDMFQLHAALIHALPAKLRQSQSTFESTGGLHACGLFSESGELILAREDVGRHNALDKLVGNALLERRLPLSRSVLLLSGRASFELIQKASMAGIPVVAAVGAPSSLAVELAQETGITLLGFVRDHRFNIYSNPARIRIAKGSP